MDFGVLPSVYFFCIKKKFIHLCICVYLLLYVYIYIVLWVYRIVQFHQPSRSGSLDSPGNHWSISDPQVFPISSRPLPGTVPKFPPRNPVYRASGFRNPQCREFLFLQTPDCRFTDTTLYVLALQARHPSHMTVVPCDPSPILHRSFGVPNVEPHKSLGLAILRSPICS
jgi:hypothetical protein